MVMLVRLVCVIALLAMASSAAVAASSSTLSVQVQVFNPVVSGGSIQIVQGGSYGQDGGCYPALTLTFATPIKAGSAIIGVYKTEDGFACPSPNGSPNTVTIGSQQATLLPRIQSSNVPGLGNCCANQQPFVLLNAVGGETALTITNNSGGNFDGMGIATEVAGFGPGASVDQDTGTYYFNPPATGADALSSGTVTPSQPGHFLYGFLMSQYGDLTAESPGTGWTQGANHLNIGADPSCTVYPCTKHPADDEYILNYNSTAPIAATFSTSNGSGEFATGIIAIKPGSGSASGPPPPPPPPGVPTEAANAGFTTLAQSWDFSQPLYATLSNWYDCSGTNFSNPSQLFHQGNPGVFLGNPRNVNQVNDGGVNVMDFQYLTSYESNGFSGQFNQVGGQTANNNGNVSIDFPNM